MKIPNYSIGAIIYIELNDIYYFDSFNGVVEVREVSLLSKNEFDKKFLLNPSPSPERANKIKEIGWIRAQKLVGEYVGSREGVIKIRPYYGIINAAYLIISDSQIKGLWELKKQ